MAISLACQASVAVLFVAYQTPLCDSAGRGFGKVGLEGFILHGWGKGEGVGWKGSILWARATDVA